MTERRRAPNLAAAIRKRYIAQFGKGNNDIKVAACLWHSTA